ncbi:30S ribosomal protein S8 [Candidatus Parcubacteria bacterium]|nr:MAG: 30S ribosomal protein S8 [Candidatus Parcubacteria bacterium]
MTDPIADMLTRIRNASAVNKFDVVLPMSKVKHELAKILAKEGWVQEVSVEESAPRGKSKTSFKELKITLKYKKSGKSAITRIRRISKPGLRIYVNKENLPKVLNNLGIAVISTPQGLMTNKEARKKGLGGEVLCEVY